jgi:hypothetical protein
VIEVTPECVKSVVEGYTFDAALSEEQNKLQQFAQLQQKVATHPKVADELDQDIVREHIFVNSSIENPFN